MRWKIDGIDIDTGKPRKIWVEAECEEDAVRQGCNCYMIVSTAVLETEQEVE